MKLTHGKVTGDPVNVLEFEALARDRMEPTAYDLAAAGEPGVRRVLEMFRAELELAMALAGCPTVAAVTHHHAAVTIRTSGSGKLRLALLLTFR